MRAPHVALPRRFVVFVAFVVFVIVGAPPVTHPLVANGAPLAAGVVSIGMTVADLERSERFFTEVLGFEKVGETEVAGRPFELLQGLFGLRMRVARLRLGDETLELTEYLAPRGRPYPDDTRSHDRWFQHVAIITSDMDTAYRRLRHHRVRHASTGPQTLPESIPAAAGIRAFYFRDPDGHFLEVLQFPPDKGLPRWHSAASLFLGIDHTAIVVADTDTSLGFYRDALGMTVAGESENLGVEQEHLNNVFGARLRITALRARTGPGVELLEYLAPGDGRPVPHDLRSNDLAFWQVTIATDDAGRAEHELIARRAALVSPGAIALPDGNLGFTSGMLVRDPDGHAVRLTH